LLNVFFPVADMGQMDPVDVYGTFTLAEARRVGVRPLDDSTIVGEVLARRSTGNEYVPKEKDVEVGVTG
jgi:NCS1 family nucleobase:cation symporter-1